MSLLEENIDLCDNNFLDNMTLKAHTQKKKG
jgi:hypothetical protein